MCPPGGASRSGVRLRSPPMSTQTSHSQSWTYSAPEESAVSQLASGSVTCCTSIASHIPAGSSSYSTTTSLRACPSTRSGVRLNSFSRRASQPLAHIRSRGTRTIACLWSSPSAVTVRINGWIPASSAAQQKATHRSIHVACLKPSTSFTGRIRCAPGSLSVGSPTYRIPSSANSSKIFLA